MAARGRKPLAEYARKRRFDRTAEPPARRATSRRALSFCVQEHAASRLHWDFRLELDGVLLSWAVPKGPSLDPADKRLAVHVEDHPVAYGGFEGVIPEGEYGGGTVLLWDRGRWEPHGDARAGLAHGHLGFTLHGEKLRGDWSLVRLRGEDGKNWLLIKAADDEARTGSHVVSERSESVKSGRDLPAIAGKHGATPRQRATAERIQQALRPARAARKARRKRATTHPAFAAGRKSRTGRPARGRSAADAGRRAALPVFVPPELCTLVDRAPEGDEWLHEVKLDGYRLLARLHAGKVRLWSRNRVDWTARLPELGAALRSLPARAALLDGELVFADRRGRTSFEGLKAALGEGREGELSYVAFDLLHLDGRDLRALPLLERKAALERLLARVPADGPLRYAPHVPGRGAQVFARACRAGLEGIVSKRADAPYRSERGGDWLKIKCIQRQEFVLVGWTPPTHAEDALGSIILGVHEGGRLRYAGRVGTGFDTAQRVELRRRLQKLEVQQPPLEVPRLPELRAARWSRPRLVGEVAFTEWTRDGRLRHPSFQGLREDKAAKDVVVEKPRPVRPAAKRAPSRPAARARRATPRRRSLALKAGEAQRARSGRATTAAAADVAGVRLTHPDKLFWPEDGISKADLARYAAAVAPAMLPHLRDRPITMVRCPDGTRGGCFYQKHALDDVAAGWRVVQMPEKVGRAPYLTVRDASGLVALAQRGVLEVHIAGVHADRPRLPDRMVFDLDPAPDVRFARVIDAARELRRRLERLKLKSFVMTSGGKGLHVVVPLARGPDIENVSAFAAGLARDLEREQPERFIAKASKAARTGRIFVDWMRNSRGATAICPYSPRARPGAAVATPLAWSELKAGLRPDGFSMRDVLARSQRKDPWAGYDKLRGKLPSATPTRRVAPRTR